MGPDFFVPFALREAKNPLEVSSILKKDKQTVKYVVLPSQIDDPCAGEGLFAGAIFQSGFFSCQLQPFQFLFKKKINTKNF